MLRYKRDDKGLTFSECHFTGLSLEAWFTDARTGGATEDRDPIVPAGGTAAGVKLLQILIPGPLQVGQSGSSVFSSCADSHQLVNWHDLGHKMRKERARGEGEKEHE